MKSRFLRTAVVTAFTSAAALAGTTACALDFGAAVENALNKNSDKLFGVANPLTASATTPDGYQRSPSDAAGDLLAAAGSLTVEYLTRNAGNWTDMMSFWPGNTNSPTHIIACVEANRETIDAAGNMNPSVQRIDLSNGNVETILRGMNRCDGIRTTDWGTVLATEETTDGGAYEIIDPLNTTEQVVLDRSLGQIVGSTGNPSTKIAKRTALPTMAWEGLTVLSTGVVIGGDELRPGSDGPDTDGGSIFRFAPANPRTGTGTISSLSQSPLVAGSVTAMQVSCREAKSSSFGQHGQGCEVGHAKWVSVSAANARFDANANQATGYYRPEDLHRDPTYFDPAHPGSLRFCWTNTGNESSDSFAEVMCAIDYESAVDPANNLPPITVNRFVEGDHDFNSFDNLAFQPNTGILYVIEDHPNGDIFACLPDGADRDIKTDGCVKIFSVMDDSAEPTGFVFSPDGMTAYVSIQHSADPADGSMDFQGYPTDDVLKITGFQLPASN